MEMDYLAKCEEVLLRNGAHSVERCNEPVPHLVICWEPCNPMQSAITGVVIPINEIVCEWIDNDPSPPKPFDAWAALVTRERGIEWHKMVVESEQ